MIPSVVKFLNVFMTSWQNHVAQIVSKANKVLSLIKHILNDYVSDYKSRLTTLKLLQLSYVKEIQDIFFYYKCLHGSFNIEFNRFTSTYDLTSTHNTTRNRLSTQQSL